VPAFRILAGRIDFRRAGRGGFALGYELEVGVVEVAEVLAAEGGGAAAVTVGEQVVAGGAILCGHGVASTPLGVRMSGQGNGDQTLEGLTLPIPRLNAKARVLRGRREFRLAVLCAVPGLDGFGSTSIVASGMG